MIQTIQKCLNDADIKVISKHQQSQISACFVIKHADINLIIAAISCLSETKIIDVINSKASKYQYLFIKI
jgi:hypothetical protein